MCECVCVSDCVCNGSVGVKLGDGQAPIGRDLKRQALFFSPSEQRLSLNVHAVY